MSLPELQAKIEARSAMVGVIGLGMVGLPVACTFAHAGFAVVGVDIKAERVTAINAGHSPIEGEEPGLSDLLAEVVRAETLRASTDYAALAQADVVTINVETPVDERHAPDYRALEAACRSLGAVMRPGVLVIVESTVAPGTTEKLVRPLLEEASGLRAHHGFYLGACPERVMPGKLLNNLRGVSRVCGGGTPETAAVMVSLYRQIVQADLDSTDSLTAEIVKTAENAYRDVQIAFANEVALICEAGGADVWRVRELVNKSPNRNMHLPGAGVGGHCIPKDPWLLAHAAGSRVPLRLIPAARAINDGMPAHVADLIVDGLRTLHCEISGARIAILGYAYLEESGDARNSPSEALVAQLHALDADTFVHDPYVPEYRGEVLEVAAGCDAAVLMVAHRAYRSLDLNTLCAALRTPLLVDGRHVFDARRAGEAGLVYRGVGQGAFASAISGTHPRAFLPSVPGSDSESPP
jgi:UDP-N-acetyl-D-mannosaminuronic acid dehydrogenase